RWAMRQRGAGLVAAAEFGFIEMDSMRVDRPPSDEAVVRVYVEIIAALRVERSDKGDLAETLRDVALHEHFGMFAPQRAGQLELLGRARGRIPRRDRVECAAPAMPAPDQRL